VGAARELQEQPPPARKIVVGMDPQGSLSNKILLAWTPSASSQCPGGPPPARGAQLVPGETLFPSTFAGEKYWVFGCRGQAICERHLQNMDMFSVPPGFFAPL